MKVSLGLLLSTQQLLEIVERYQTVNRALHEELPRVLVVPTEIIVNLALRCGWLNADVAGHLVVSDLGNAVLSAAGTQSALRVQLLHFAQAERPPWLGLTSKGRDETLPHLSSDTRDVFREAGLTMSPPGPDVVEWWDAAAAVARTEFSSELTRLGRIGERLSITYETARVGEQPFWEPIETNRAGYDLISRVRRGTATELLIEVKGSNQSMSNAAFYVSRNEWRVAQQSPSFVFHLWLLRKPERIAVVSVDDVEPHIAEERGDGEWDSVVVPMKCFERSFVSYDPR